MVGHTVSDFMNKMRREVSLSDFLIRSKDHNDFWEKIKTMGARNIKTHPPEKVPDIDATVILSDEEWRKLEAEFKKLKK